MPDFARMLDEVQYSLLVMIAGLHWSLQKSLFMSGYTIKLINQWLIDNAFVPIISQTNDSLRLAVGLVFVVAMLILGITYLLAAFVRLDVVSPRNAMLWYVAGALFFSVGPSLYQGMNTFRMQIGEVMYLSVLNGLQSNSGSAFNSLSQINNNDVALGYVCDQFDVYLPGATSAGAIDGMDIALAYLRGHAQDVMGYPQPIVSSGCGAYLLNPNPATWATTGGTSVVPMDWNQPGGYFDDLNAPINWDTLTDVQRDVSVALAGASQRRALTAWPLILFALAEQIVHLLITIAMGMTFISFGVAILFAFFKRTESIAQSLINQWIELIVQTVAISLVQALVVGFCLAGAATGSAAAVMGIGLISLVFILITLWSGVKAVWNSFNRLFNAIGQVSGNVMISPGSMALGAVAGTAAVATGGAALAASATGNALAGMNALQHGATPAQTAGLMFGGNATLMGAARTLSYVHSLRGTALGEAAEQFTEGAMTRQVARDVPLVGRFTGPALGAMLLSDRDPQEAAYDRRGRVVARPMLVPAVGDMMDNWTLPNGSKRKRELAQEDAPTRVGEFTQLGERQAYNRDMNSEEMEQHLTDLQRSSGAGALEQAASRLGEAANTLQLAFGQLRVSGSADVAGVVGDAIRAAQLQQPHTQTMDNFTLGNRLAQAMGVTPVAGQAPIQTDLARSGIFANQVLGLGMSGTQADQMAREVKSSTDGRLSDETRQTLITQLQTDQKIPLNMAQESIVKLEQSAQMLPNTITATGLVAVPAIAVNPEVNVTVETPKTDAYDEAMKQESAMSGSSAVIGGSV